jgi:hypothetical protein
MSSWQLTTCIWSSTDCNSKELANPSWEDVEQAIKALDGKARNDVYLSPDPAVPETFLCVGGGNGEYVVSGSVEGERFPTVVVPGGSDELVSLIVGGQLSEFPRRFIVDLNAALTAAKSFLESGRFGEGDVVWEDV